MDIDTSFLYVPPLVGVVLTFLIPLVTRQQWPRVARFIVATAITMVVAGIALFVAWQSGQLDVPPTSVGAILIWVVLAFGAGQLAYGLLKPFGLYEWPERLGWIVEPEEMVSGELVIEDNNPPSDNSIVDEPRHALD